MRRAMGDICLLRGEFLTARVSHQWTILMQFVGAHSVGQAATRCRKTKTARDKPVLRMR